MKYVLKQKMFALGDDFTIKNERDEPVFHVDGKVFTIGKKLSFNDMSGNQLLRIEQKLLSWGPTYEIIQGDRVAATVKKAIFTFFKCKFSVDVPGPDDLEARGDFLDHEYTFYRGSHEVATVSKKWFSLTDTYGVDVSEGEDPLLILASTIVIDMACHQGGKGD